MKQALLVLLVFALTSCSMLPGRRDALALMKEKKYSEAIQVLEKNNNFFNKNLLHDCYIEYGVWILQNTDPKSEASVHIKDQAKALAQFKKALQIDPKSRKANELYLLVNKLQKRRLEN